MPKYYHLVQTKRGISLATTWLTDIPTGAPNLCEIDFIDWLSDDHRDTYQAARDRWSHLLGN
jgi:hypothetical protein